MRDEPLVTIIIPCKNMGTFVREAISSAVSQSYPEVEVIVVDDGSDDVKTRKILKKIEVERPQIKVYYKENSGLSGARNYGIERCNGKYVVCLDADDKLAPYYVEKTLELIEKDNTGKTAFVTTWLQEFGLRQNVWQTSSYDPIKILQENVVSAGSLFRKDVWKEVGGYKKEMNGGYEDWDFWLSIIERGYRWEVLEQPLFYYRIRQNSMLSGSVGIHGELYNRLYKLHEKLFTKNSQKLLLSYSDEVQKLIRLYNDTQKLLQGSEEKAFILTEELERLKLSRVTRPFIKLRDMLIIFRSFYNDKRISLYRNLRDLLPSSVRKTVKSWTNRILSINVTYITNKKLAEGQPLVTIVTPFYNSADTIMETVDSVLSQTFQNFEYIIINDGSDQIESKVLSNISDGKIRILSNKENRGKGSPAAARNQGIAEAKGKYVVCLDADDYLDPTYLEKCLVALETDPGFAIVSTNMKMFGVTNRNYDYGPYKPQELLRNNIVSTAAMFRKECWDEARGYKTGIGYEDWEFWMNLAEHGHYAKNIEEGLFYYRTSNSSRYIDDRSRHEEIVKELLRLHPNYKQNIQKNQKKLRKSQQKIVPSSSMANLDSTQSYLFDNTKTNILVFIPWMTFGGAETLLYNFCKEIEDEYAFSFFTGIKSENEWESRFREISNNIYHLENIISGGDLYVEYITNYIKTRDVKVLHIIHNNCLFDILPEIRKRNPELKIVVTFFNSKVNYFNEAIKLGKYVDLYTTDNNVVGDIYRQCFSAEKSKVILNGIDTSYLYNPSTYKRDDIRAGLGLKPTDIAIVFVGRLSQEKNVLGLLQITKNFHGNDNLKFVIVGDGKERQRVIREMHKSGNIIYLGYRQDIPEILTASDVFLLTSLVEGFPQTILEAMSLEKIVIASSVGQIPEVIDGKNGYIFDPTNIAEAIEFIKEVTANFETKKKIGQKARETVIKKYSLEEMGDKYRNLYSELI